MTDETEAALDLSVARNLENRLIRIESHLDSLDRSINLASGGLHVLVWLGGVSVSVAGVIIAILTYLHIMRPDR
jgi:hypothetical protein